MLRVMVLSPSRLYVHWRVAGAADKLALRCSDLSGRPPQESLDGTGWRLVPVPDDAGGAYLEDLPPGHILWLELVVRAADGPHSIVAAPPVELPWVGPVPLPRASAGHVSRS